MHIVPHTFEHPIPGGHVRLLGARDRVTGAMTQVQIGGKSILVDCGKPQGKDAHGWQCPEQVFDADALVLTHGHLDHVSAIVRLLERFDGPIYGTAATLPGVRLELHEAGHILGSASVELESDAVRVICSGDLGRPDSPLLRDYRFVDGGARPPDLVVMESTYGDRDHGQAPDFVLSTLERIVNRVARRGGRILIPSFAIGRTQTLLYYLNALVEAGRIDDVPVAVDSPMALRVTEMYSRHRHLFDDEARHRITGGDDPLDFDGLYAVRRHRDSERLRGVEQPMVVIAGSGMCTGGRVVGHLKELLPDPDSCLLFAGYQARGTLGRRIQRAAERSSGRVAIHGEQIPIRACVTTLSGLSAHADRSELLSWLGAIDGVERVALHHGETGAQEAFVGWARARASAVAIDSSRAGARSLAPTA